LEKIENDNELRKRLAEGVMGCQLDQSGCYWHKVGNATQVPMLFDVHAWHPDTDIAQTMMVAEKIGLHLELVRYENGQWKRSIHKMVYPPASYDGGRDDTPALAICLAADAWLKGRG